MITITYRDAEGRREITVDGHADYAPRGADIVCAGASALCMALMSALENAGIDMDYEIRDGYLSVNFSKNNSRDICHTILCGFYEMAQQYPDNITIRS